jgi:tetratricopeptide (TPR) repeat protein
MALTNLGNVRSMLSQFDVAFDLYEQALKIDDNLNDKRGTAITLGNLGNIQSDQGFPLRALPYYEQQLAIANEIDEIQIQIGALGNLGNVYAAGEEHWKAK